MPARDEIKKGVEASSQGPTGVQKSSDTRVKVGDAFDATGKASSLSA